MKTFKALTLINFKKMFHMFALGSGKKKSLKGAIIISLVAALIILYMTFSSIQLAKELAKNDMQIFVLLYGMIITSIVVLISTVVPAADFFVPSKENELLFSLPIKTGVVVLSKIVSLFLFNMLLAVVVLLPNIIAYFCFAKVTIVGLLGAMLSCALVPIIPFSIALILSIAFAFVNAIFKNNNIIKIFFGLILLALVLYLSFSLADISSFAQSYIEGAFNKLEIIAPFISQQAQFISGQFVKSWLYLPLIAIFTFVLSWQIINKLFITLHKKISGLKQLNFNSKTKAFKPKKAIFALLSKELKRYFSSYIYVLNTIIGALMFAFISVYAAVDKEGVMRLVGLGGESFFQLVILTVAVLISFSSTTACSISLEGKCINYLKSLPIPYNRIYASKVFANVVIVLPFVFFGTIVLAAAGVLFVWQALLCLMVGILSVGFASCFGLLINLLLPKLNYMSEMSVVKQSLASILGALIPSAISGLVFALSFTNVISFNAAFVLALCLWVSGIIIMSVILKTYGRKLYMNLNV